MNGLELCVRFAFPPHHKKYCGEGDLTPQMAKYLETQDASLEPELREGFSHFEGLYPHLELIAAHNDREPFDYEVAEAYWLGNDLLARVPKDRWRAMVRARFVGEDRLPTAEGEAYANAIDASGFPHHSFHVLRIFSHTGSVMGRVGPGLDKVNACKVTWGRVTAVSPDAYTVVHAPIGVGDGKFVFLPEEEARVLRALPGVEKPVTDAQEGEWVACHWSVACKVLSDAELANLQKYTRANMTALFP